MNTTRRFELNQLDSIWSPGDIQSIINHDLFYISFQANNQLFISFEKYRLPMGINIHWEANISDR